MQTPRAFILLGLLLNVAAYAQNAVPPLPEKPADVPEGYLKFLRGAKNAQVEHLADNKMSYMGLGLGEVEASTAKAMGLPTTLGVRIAHVEENGPSGKAGFKDNDILVKFDDQHLFNPQQLTALVQLKKPGDIVEIGLVRASKYISITLTLGSRPLMTGDRERMEGTPFNPNQEFLPPPQRPEKPVKPFGENDF